MGVRESLVSIVLGLSAAFNPLYAQETPDPTPAPKVQPDVPTEDNAVERYLKDKGYYEKFINKMRETDPAKKDSDFPKYLKESGIEEKIEKMADFKKWKNDDFTFDENPIPEFNPNPAPKPVVEPAPQPPQPVPTPVPQQIPVPLPLPVVVPQPVPQPKPAIENPIPDFNPDPKPSESSFKKEYLRITSSLLEYLKMSAPAKPAAINTVPDSNPVVSPAIPDDKANFFAGLYVEGNYGGNRTSKNSNVGVQASAGTETDSGKRNQVFVQGLIESKEYESVKDVKVSSNDKSAGIGYENNRFAGRGNISKSSEEFTDPRRVSSSTSGNLTTKTTTDNKTEVSENILGARFNINLYKSEKAKKESYPRILFSLFDRDSTTSVKTNVMTDVIDAVDPTASYTLFLANEVKIKEHLQGLDFEVSNSFKAEHWDDDEFVNYGLIGRFTKDRLSGAGLDRKIDEFALGIVLSGEFNRHSIAYDEDGRRIFKDDKQVWNNDGLMCIYELSVGASQIKDSDGIENDKLSMFGFADAGLYGKKLSALASGNSKDKKSGMGEGVILFSYRRGFPDGDKDRINLSAFRAFHNYFRLANRTETGFNQSYGRLADLQKRIAREIAINQLASFKNIDGALMAGWSNDDNASRASGSAYVLFPVDSTLMIKTSFDYEESHAKGSVNYIGIISSGSIGAITSNGNSLDFRMNVERDARRKDSVTTLGLTYTHRLK